MGTKSVGIGAAALYAGDGPVQPRDMARKVMAFPDIRLLEALLRECVGYMHHVDRKTAGW